MARLQHQSFASRLQAHLCERYGQAWADLVTPAQQSEFLRRILSQAPQWGLHSEADIAELAMLLVEMRQAQGPGPMPKWFAQVAADASLKPAAKLHQWISRWHEQLQPSLAQLTAAAPR